MDMNFSCSSRRFIFTFTGPVKVVLVVVVIVVAVVVVVLCSELLARRHRKPSSQS